MSSLVFLNTYLILSASPESRNYYPISQMKKLMLIAVKSATVLSRGRGV